MIRNSVTLGGRLLIVIYHKGYDNFVSEKKKKRIEKIGRLNLIFEETIVNNDMENSIEGWAWKNEGLLYPDDEKNTYRESACAYIEEYFFLDKPKAIFCLKNDIYSLALPIEQFERINSFIEKYTGFNIRKNPMCYGNIIVYNCRIVECKSNKNEDLIIEKLFEGATAIVRFKKDNTVVYTSILSANQYTENTVLTPKIAWDSHDIEVYKENQLYYANKNIHYARTLHLSLNLSSQNKVINLKKLSKDFALKSKGHETKSTIGEKTDELRYLYHKSNYSITKRLKNEELNDAITFINPGEIDVAMRIITEVLQSDCDQVWVFDAYFSDRNKIIYTLDWLRVIAHCNKKGRETNIVFFSKSEEKALGMNELIDEIRKDSVINEVMRNMNKPSIKLHQTKKPIHDRFIITRTNDILSGLAIGTSFNSLDENHYCINKLDHISSKKIWTDLKQWMENGNITAVKEI